MWTPGLICPMFCTSVTAVAFSQDPQVTDETRDHLPPRGTEGTSAGAMEEQQVVVLGVLRVCFFVTSRGQCALCCACYASCASYVSCLCVAFRGETSRCSRSAKARRYNAFILLLGMVRHMQVDGIWEGDGLLYNPFMARLLSRKEYYVLRRNIRPDVVELLEECNDQ